jgi:hypothetical protein
MMIYQFLEEGANAAVDEDDHLLILICFLQLQEDELKTAAPKYGGSKCGRKKGRVWRIMLLCMPKNQHIPLEDFRQRCSMNKELFMMLVHGVREYDDYFMVKKDCTEWMVSHQSKNALLQ